MKIGDIISLKTAINKKQEKIVPFNFEGETQNKLFEIIGEVPMYESFLVLVGENLIGWFISPWYVDHCQVPKKYIGKKFFEINAIYTE